MDEQNARASEDSYPSTELNAESSNFAREYLPEQNQPTHELETAGDRSCFVDVTSPARKWVDGFVDDNAHLKDSTQSVVTQSGLQDDEDAKDSGQLPTCIESLEIGRVDPDQQLCGSASADTDMICVVQEDGVDAGSEDISMPDGRAALTHVDGLEETGGSHSAHFTVDDDRDEGTSLEMLSVAVESFENMQRRSEEGFKNFSNALENLEFRKWQTIEGTAAEMETDSINKLSMTKSTNESEDNESSVIDGSSAPSAEFQDKEHFLNMLCELAAVRQQERERSSISQQLASCMTSLANNDELSDESKRLSFVDLLRKQMVHVGAFTDLSADAIYEELLKQNQEFLGCKVGKDLNLPTPFGSKFSNEGAMASLEIDKKSTGTFHRKSDVPSTDEISHDSESGDIKPLAKSGGASKEETGDDQNLVVGDLVWAKVKSHPWWPGQIFDVADASAAAKRIQKPGRTLVAFFGDGTFNWLWQSQLIPFVPNFADKVKQTTMKSFCRAVADALDEVSRRTELGLKCSHLGDAVYSKNLFPDLNAGIKKGVRLECHKDIEVSKGQLQPERVLKFLRTAACSPLYSLSSGLEYSKLCGHVYGFRSFMLSSKRPERNPTLVNPIKPENSMQRSVLKRRLGQDEPGGGPNFGVGKEMKRRHLSKDAGVKESSAGGRVQSPRLRSIETLLTTEDEESKAAESDLKSHEQAQGSTWLAKGKRLHVSPECKEKKRVRGWQSLGPLRDAKKLGIETTVDNSGSSDDDNRTLFDITGYHSLKTKKKGVRKSTTDVPSKAVGQQLLKVKQELSKKQRSVDLDENRDAEDGLPEIGNSLLLSQPDPCLPPVIEDSKNAEKGKIETREPLDSQNAGDKDTQDCRKAEKGNDDMMDLRDADLEVREQVKEETSDLKVDCMESTKKQETKLLDSKAERENERFEAELKAEVRDSSEKGNETLDVRIAQKSEKEHLKSKSIDQIEKDEVELGVDNPAGKQTKRRNSETGDNLGRLIKLKKKRRQDAQDYPQGSLSSVPESEETIPRKSVKTSKLGLSLRKVAGALKGRPRSLNSAKHVTSKYGLSHGSVDCAASKGTIGLKSDYPSPKRPALAGGRSGLNKEDFNSSLPKLLNILQVVATDPLSSANMRSSLEGVMSVFLKFRNMVFLKSSGYAAATASGKLLPSIANGQLSDDKKVDEKGRSGRKTSNLETQQTGSKDSSVEQKASLKMESFSESTGGPGSQRLVELDTFCEARAADSKGLGITSAVPGSNMQNSVADNEQANVAAQAHGKILTAENQRSCVQDLAVAARKRKSEVLQESVTKVLGKREGLKGLPERLLAEKKSNKDTVVDTRHHAKSVRHHISRSEGLSVSGKRSSLQSSGNAKVALGLFMQFPEDYTLPSETELRELFNRFGTLETFGIRVYKNASTAQVVFKHSGDAEVAWQHARKNRMFGQANVSYRLRHFSLSSKSEAKPLSTASARKGSLEIKNLKSTRLENFGRPSLAKQSTGGPEKGSFLKPQSPAADSLSSRVHLEQGGLRVAEQTSIDRPIASICEPVPAHSPVGDSLVSKAGPGGLQVLEQGPVQIGISSRPEPVPLHSPASIPLSTVSVPHCVSSSTSGPELEVGVGPPIMHQQAGFQSLSSAQCTLDTSSLNSSSVPNVNGSAGDIQDQMMKLLQQVSVIVSSTALTHRST